MSINKVLIVDDSRIARVMLKKSLQSTNWDIHEADDGSVAIQKLTSDKDDSPYDLVFLDLTMNDMDGPEVLRQMKSQALSAPVIVVSADYQQKMKDLVSELGALEMVTKPITPKKIEEILSREGLL